MEIFEIIKSVVEFLYFLSGIGLLVGVYFGYAQLKTMRKDMEDNHKRNSVEKTIEYLNWFASTFVPLLASGYDKIDGKEVVVFKELKSYPFDFNEEVPRSEKITKSIAVKIEAEFDHISNQLEYFSAAMVSGLANEQLAFYPLSKIYCTYIENAYDFYCYSRVGARGKNLYKNTIELYNLWNDRLKDIELEESQKLLNEQRSKLNVKTIEPIGTK